jgi:hypothetical protein
MIDERANTPINGWMPAQEREVVFALSLLLGGRSNENSRLIAGDLLEPGPWMRVFLLGEQVAAYGTFDDGVEIWNKRSLRFWGYRRTPTLAYLLRDFAKAEDHGQGWHLHLTYGGKRLGYRFLFDARRDQGHLAWEAHGSGAERPWGDPAQRVLSRGRAEKVHLDCLRACASTGQLRNLPFRAWAARFVQPGHSTFVAYPAPEQVRRW